MSVRVPQLRLRLTPFMADQIHKIALREARSEMSAPGAIAHEGDTGRGGDEMSKSPMDKAHEAPRCTARSKRSGQRCRAPAVRGWRVCRMHGARGGAPEGERNGNYRHGARTKEAIELTKLIRKLRSR